MSIPSEFPAPELSNERNRSIISAWLECDDAAAVCDLRDRADRVRRQAVGDAVYLRGLIEVGNVCRRRCTYCGLSADNTTLSRYRLSDDQILSAVQIACDMNFGTVVLQSGEDQSFTVERVSALIRKIKDDFGVAVTLSLGERTVDELAAWHDAGADRYLLRFETGDPDLYAAIHPACQGDLGRIGLLRELRRIGYEVGSGVMVGIPGQTRESLAYDIASFQTLELDMIGIGPYIAHPATSLGVQPIPDDPQQVHGTIETMTKVLALSRLLRPQANIPATTAVGIRDGEQGRAAALQAGANVIMPNCTPARYRELYEIYPGKAGVKETHAVYDAVEAQLASLGRFIGEGPGTSPAYESRRNG